MEPEFRQPLHAFEFEGHRNRQATGLKSEKLPGPAKLHSSKAYAGPSYGYLDPMEDPGGGLGRR